MHIRNKCSLEKLYWHEVHVATLNTAGTMELMFIRLLFPPDEMFEQLHIEAFSSPPELPDVMKPQDSGSTANEQAVQWKQREETEQWREEMNWLCVE